jgi:hypothetical protein
LIQFEDSPGAVTGAFFTDVVCALARGRSDPVVSAPAVSFSANCRRFIINECSHQASGSAAQIGATFTLLDREFVAPFKATGQTQWDRAAFLAARNQSKSQFHGPKNKTPGFNQRPFLVRYLHSGPAKAGTL